MNLYKKIKNSAVKNINPKYLELISKRGITLSKIPKHSSSVTSDLFLYRIENNWSTFFELLNVNYLIDNDNLKYKIFEVEIIFFNNSGDLVERFEIKNIRNLKHRINIKEITGNLDIKHDGTFAVIHKNSPIWLKDYDCFLSERGYTGYENNFYGPIKSYVHGNLDAIYKESIGNIKQLGNFSFLKKKYFIQHRLLARYSYDFFWVNPTNRKQKLIIHELSESNTIITKIQIEPMGFYKYSYKKSSNKTNSIIKIQSRLYMARPIVFKYMENSFDVFHG
tara:strand:- start:1061 stop:1897 length:837 start_codon:yes stop_codon:yes gene_type:complete